MSATRDGSSIDRLRCLNSTLEKRPLASRRVRADVEDAGFDRDADGNRGDAQDLVVGRRVVAVDAHVLDDERPLRANRADRGKPRQQREQHVATRPTSHLSSSLTRKRICTSAWR